MGIPSRSGGAFPRALHLGRLVDGRLKAIKDGITVHLIVDDGEEIRYELSFKEQPDFSTVGAHQPAVMPGQTSRYRD